MYNFAYKAREIRQLEVLFHHLNVSFNPNLSIVMNYSISENHKSFSFKYELIKEVEQINTELKIQRESLTNPGAYTIIVNEHVNYCTLVKNPWMAPSTYLVYTMLQASSQRKLDVVCPMQPVYENYY